MILNPIELERRCKNLELHGLQESENENCKERVKEIITKVIPDEIKISDAFRFGSKFYSNGENKIRPIVIKFEEQDQRNKVLNGRANLRKLENQKLYLNENLPANLKQLRGKANQLRNNKNYKFIWVKNGTILVRKSENTNAIAIKKISDLEKII